MFTTRKRLVAAAVALTGAAGAAAADLITGDLVVRDSLCVGSDCADPETSGTGTIKLKDRTLRDFFDDTSTAMNRPANDWQLVANDSTSGGASYFAIEDSTAGRTVFSVAAGAPENPLSVDSEGDLELGNAMPLFDLHALSGNAPTIRAEQDNSIFSAQIWDIVGNETGFLVRDGTNGAAIPFRNRPDAPAGALTIDPEGNVGIGNFAPSAPLEVRRFGSFVFMRLTANGASPNTYGDVTFTDAGTVGELRYNIVDGDGPEMRLDASGNMVLAGEITTAGSCSVGCDRVFAPDYPLPRIEAHAAAMWANGYLPNVGPTPEEGPTNLSRKMAGILNELEHAHIYIAVLEAALAER